jgi:hypothetical protein
LKKKKLYNKNLFIYFPLFYFIRFGFSLKLNIVFAERLFLNQLLAAISALRKGK